MATDGNEFSVPPLGHAIGGSIGSALALLLFYPLERARTELQAHVVESGNDIDNDNDAAILSDSSSSDSWETTCSNSLQSSVDSGTDKHNSATRREDLLTCLVRLEKQKELYRGVAPVITTLALSNFVFFYAHETIKRMLQHRSLIRSLLASTLAGVVNVLVTNPLWVANIRIMVQGQNNTTNNTTTSLIQEMRRIMKTEGLSSLWNGTYASLMLVSNPVIQFFLYEQLKAIAISRHRKRRCTISPTEAFFMGALAKGVATLLTYPLQLTQVLLRLQQSNKGSTTSCKYDGTLDCLVKLYSGHGLRALFTGMKAKLLQTVLTSAFTFLTYEEILRAVKVTLFPSLDGERLKYR